jgi:signal transduction histidine kinase/ligand-binding sensor domain-containing protein/CheY-like chemotaxis protein
MQKALTKWMSVISVALVILFLGLFSSFVNAQQLQFNHYSLDQGYYDGIVTAFYQDQYRYLWIGTADGLYRFDGYEFKEYRKNTDDPAALNSNVITDIEEDRYGRLWIGTEGGGLSLLNREQDEFIHFRHDPNDPRSISSYFISKILKDQKGNLWVGTEKKGLSVLKFSNEKEDFSFLNFGPLSQDGSGLQQGEINMLFEDSKGNIWVGTDIGLVRIRYSSLEKLDITFFNHDTQNPEATLADDLVYSINEDHQGRIWVGTSRGLSCYEPATGRFTNFRHDPSDPNSLSNDIIRSLELEDDNQIWVGTNKGLNLFNVNTYKNQRYYHEPQRANSISEDLVMGLFKDDQGNTWAGTWGGALNRISPLSRQFTHFPYIPGNDQSLSDPLVYSITEDNSGRIWVATPKGLDCFDRETQKYTHYHYQPNIPDTEVFSGIFRINSDKEGHIWIGSRRGAFRFDPSSGNIQAFEYEPGKPDGMPDASVWDVIEDRFGLIWMGTYGGGVLCWNPSTDSLQRFRYDPYNANSLGDNRVMELYEGGNGDVWVGTYEGGLTRIKRKPNGSIASFERFVNDPADDSSISSNVVWSVLEDKNGDVWVGTGNGLNHLNLADRTFKSYKEGDGLANNFVFGMLSGQDDKVWLSTNRGLSLFDPATEGFQNYNIRDGLQQSEFNKGAFWKGRKEGELFFGGVNGMIQVRNNIDAERSYHPQVVINKMVVFESNNELNNTRIDYGVGFREEIKLAHHENTLEFEFTALNFINGSKNQYSYRLKGLNNKWINLGAKHVIRFGGLSPGWYTLEVRAANTNGDWSDHVATLGIQIQAPWWATFPAKVFYALLGILLLVLIYRFIIDKKLAERESERLREQDAFKTRLYTDITHEFRTPLTVISGMADEIEGNEKARHLIKRNSRNLLNLVNQMLELRKLESGALVFNYVQADIIRFARITLEPFYGLAAKRNIDMQVFSSNHEIWMDFDQEVMHRIIANLVSNAIKYNKESGRVDVQLSSIVANGGSKLLLIVKDTGIGIPEVNKEHIFDRFYQIGSEESSASQGSGIGLALVKEYVEALGGNIFVESELDLGTTFKIILPIFNKAEKLLLNQKTPSIEAVLPGVEEPEKQIKDMPRESMNPEQARVLIVEDNPDVIYYLKSCLSGLYNILVEHNGADGIQKALEEVPDLIISDLMMPQKDGYELVRVVKNDIRTSHIPVILLTAKADLPSKLKGLDEGADAYLTKPFNRQELLLRVSNLLKLREKLQARYQSVMPSKEKKGQPMQKEDAFIVQVQKHIKANLSDPDFGVKELCQEVGLSRTQLHNKLKALSNRSTSIYIRSIRLQVAQRLLEESDKTIAEIAYEVGFNDPNYFSRTFNQEFGASPSQYRQENT